MSDCHAHLRTLTLRQLWRATDDHLRYIAEAERAGNAARAAFYSRLFHAAHDVIDEKERARDERRRKREARLAAGTAR